MRVIFLKPRRAKRHLNLESTTLEDRMYVVTGATGHTGSVIAKRLLARGKKVRAVGRNAERLSSLVSLGAEPFAADMSNKEVTARAFSGAEAAYVMIPPDLANPDYAAYQDKVIEAIASALEKGTPAHVVCGSYPKQPVNPAEAVTGKV
jgi:uncharacterized protein YbjT (DUF2867 family)